MTPNDAVSPRADVVVSVFDAKHVVAAGNKPKAIAEYIGRVASADTALSIARMVSPEGWLEPAQTPDFDEYSVVLRGELHVTVGGKTEVVRAGQSVHVPRGLTVQYSTPGADGAEYVAVCTPAFSPDTVHRTED